MAQTFILHDEASDLTGGADFSNKLLEATGVDGDITVSVLKSATEISYGFTESGIPGADGATGDYTVEVEVETGDTNINISIRLHRVNSAGTVQASNTASAEQSGAAGIKTFSFTAVDLGTWASGDRLRVDYLFRNANSHSTKSVVIGTDTTDNEVVAPFTVAAASFELAADPGSYAKTGILASIAGAFVLAAAVGSMAVGGAAAQTLSDRLLGANVGSYEQTGVAATLEGPALGVELIADAGSYSLSGVAASTVASRVLDGAVGSYELGGVATDPDADRVAGGTSGTYTLSGTVVEMDVDRGVAVTVGAYALDGAAVALVYNSVLNAVTGAYSLGGETATLGYSGGGGGPPVRGIVGINIGLGI